MSTHDGEMCSSNEPNKRSASPRLRSTPYDRACSHCLLALDACTTVHQARKAFRDWTIRSDSHGGSGELGNNSKESRRARSRYADKLHVACTPTLTMRRASCYDVSGTLPARPYTLLRYALPTYLVFMKPKCERPCGRTCDFLAS